VFLVEETGTPAKAEDPEEPTPASFLAVSNSLLTMKLTGEGVSLPPAKPIEG